MKKILLLSFMLLVFLFITGCGDSGGQVDKIEANTFIIGGEAMPQSLNFFVNYSSLSLQIAGLIYEPLCGRNLDTWELEGRLAKSWTISEDKLTFTFTLDERARWADGFPVTTDDFLFTYETIMNPENLTSLFRLEYENVFTEVSAPDEKTIVFKVKDKKWSNFITAYTFVIFPKHEYEGKDFNKDFTFYLPPGSGPYVIDEVEEERFITLKRRSDYWYDEVKKDPRDIYNFDYIKYKFITEDSILLRL